MHTFLIIAAIASFILGGLFTVKYVIEKKKAEKKGFLVLLGSILFIWFFPSIAFFTIGIVCLLLLLGFH